MDANFLKYSFVLSDEESPKIMALS